MRRHKLLLVAGVLAYFFGATAKAYLRCAPEDFCSERDAGYRILLIVEHPQAVLLHPIKAIEFLVAPSAQND